MKTKQKTSRRQLTPTEWAKLLSVAESEMKGLILLAMTTDQRIRDIIALKHVDIDMRRNVIRFRIARADLVLEVQLDPVVRTWIEEQPQSILPTDSTTPLLPHLAGQGPLKTAAFLRTLGKKCGIPVGVVLCRSTFLCRLRKSGIPLTTIYEDIERLANKPARVRNRLRYLVA